MPILTTTTGFSVSGSSAVVSFFGVELQAGFATDASGDLFVAAGGGGQYSDGQIFEIAKTASGYASTPSVAVSFDGTDGETPNGGLITNANGDLFGTTYGGGANSDGTVFEIAPTPTGLATTPTVLVSFNGTDGETPTGGLVADAQGDLFGITSGGGANGNGVVFEIAKTASGYASTPTVLTSLATADGSSPNGKLAIDAAGDLFATMQTGGANGEGTLLEIANTPSGYAATPTILASFNGTDGGYPAGAPSIDANGDLFGTTHGGGTDGDGVIYELAHTASGYASTPTVLTSFTHEDTSNQALLVDAAGDLIGAKSPNGGGIETIYELVNTPGGYLATPTTVVTFPSSLTFVEGLLTADASGDLFGLSEFSGPGGTVFELTGAPFEVAGAGSVAGLPDVSLDFIPSVARAIAAQETALIGGGAPNEVVAGNGSPPAPVAGRLNALVVAGPNAAAATMLPSGYQEGILATASSLLADSTGGALLVATGAATTLMGAANDTLYGGNFNTTLVAGTGAETLTSGIGENLIFLKGPDADVNSNGADTIVGGSADATVNASGSSLIFGNGSAMNVVAGAGAAATVVGGAGGTTLSGGSSGTLYFASGPTTYTAGTGVDTLVGLGAAITATGGANGAEIFTGTAGGSSVSSGAGFSTILGLGQGDVLTATGSGNQVFGATAGAETINATASSGSNAFFTFGQNDVVETGSVSRSGTGTTYVENLAGSLTLIGGSGAFSLDIAATGARTVTVENFSAANDEVQISNSSASAVNAALASASVTNGSETLTLSDGSLLSFQGVTGLTSQSVFAVTTFQFFY